MTATASVLVVDDHPVVVEGIRRLFEKVADLKIIGSASTKEEALAAAEQLQPDLVVLDLRLEDEVNPLLCRSILQLAPHTRIVMHTAYDDPEPLRACMAGGAFAVVPKNGKDLVLALRSALAGESFSLPEPPTSADRSSVFTGADLVVYESLTTREYQVLCLIATGQTSSEIAQELFLATNTVRSYTQTLLKKLHARNRIEALITSRRLRILGVR